MLAQIIERAATLKAARSASDMESTKDTKAARGTKTTKDTKSTKDPKGKTKSAAGGSEAKAAGKPIRKK